MGPLHIVMLFIRNEDIADVNLKKNRLLNAIIVSNFPGVKGLVC